jgi:phosphatidylserine decarboxylase
MPGLASQSVTRMGEAMAEALDESVRARMSAANDSDTTDTTP